MPVANFLFMNIAFKALISVLFYMDCSYSYIICSSSSVGELKHFIRILYTRHCFKIGKQIIISPNF